MATKRLGFKPSLREQQLKSIAAQEFWLLGCPPEKRAAAQALLDGQKAQVKQKRERAAPRDLEGPVVAAISELLAVHPRVIWAARFNSGMASYEAKSGRYAPVWFHKFLRAPEKMRMPDFFGILLRTEVCAPIHEWVKEPRPFAIEAKAPGWTKPRDDREREQAAFLQMIRNAGGIGIFATSVDEVAAALK
jgi:hypothetical protein